MIRRGVKIQLVAFVVISLVGIVYVGLNYIGVNVTNHPYTVKLMLADTGGIFPNAAVTERGVDIGRVGSMRLTPSHQVEVTLNIKHGTKISANRSEERRVGKECRSRWWTYHEKKRNR